MSNLGFPYRRHWNTTCFVRLKYTHLYKHEKFRLTLNTVIRVTIRLIFSKAQNRSRPNVKNAIVKLQKLFHSILVIKNYVKNVKANHKGESLVYCWSRLSSNATHKNGIEKSEYHVSKLYLFSFLIFSSCNYSTTYFKQLDKISWIYFNRFDLVLGILSGTLFCFRSSVSKADRLRLRNIIIIIIIIVKLLILLNF